MWLMVESSDKKASQGNKAVKNKGSKGNNEDRRTEGVPKLLREVGFWIARDGPDLYLKAMKRLGLYVCTTYKNSSIIQMCLDSKELICQKNWLCQRTSAQDGEEWRDPEAEPTLALHGNDFTMWLLEDMRRFDNEHYEGIVFAQKDILCNL